MKIIVIDAQGGGIGRSLVAGLRQANVRSEIIAAGTNAIASSNMLKAGANEVGIVIADALLGEITPAMSVAIGQSNAKKLLIPVNHCNNIVVGVADLSMQKLVDAVVQELGRNCQ